MRNEDKSGPEGPLSCLEFFWEYHKWHVMITAFLLIAGWITVRDLAGRETPDLKITFISAVAYGKDVCRDQTMLLQEALGEGGGSLGCSFILLPEVIDGQKTYQDAVYLSKLMVEISEGKNCIVVMDENAGSVLEAYQKGYFSDIREIPPDYTAPGIVQKLMIALKAPEQSRCEKAVYEKEKSCFFMICAQFAE